jgi:hypothetical protein
VEGSCLGLIWSRFPVFTEIVSKIRTTGFQTKISSRDLPKECYVTGYTFDLVAVVVDPVLHNVLESKLCSFADLLDVQNILSADTVVSHGKLKVSQCYAFECDRSFYCALFCVFMTRVKSMPTQLVRWTPDVQVCTWPFERSSNELLNVLKRYIFLAEFIYAFCMILTIDSDYFCREN